MEIIGLDSRNNKLIVEMQEGEFAKFAGFAGTYSLKDSIKLEPGTVVDVGQCWNDSKDALDEHKIAIKAAQQLKSSSTRFLNFFKDMPD